MSTPQPNIVVAVIRREGKVLALPLGSAVPQLWELPRGEMQQNESAEYALKRALRDRYALNVEVGTRLHHELHSYQPHAEWTVSLFLCTSNTPLVTLEESGMRWVGPDDEVAWSGPEGSALHRIWDEPRST